MHNVRRSLCIVALAVTGIVGISPAGAIARSICQPVRVPGAWGPSTATTTAIDAWQKKEIAGARRRLASVHNETSGLMLRLRQMYIEEAATAMRANRKWAQTEPWLAAGQPFPAVCDSAAAETIAALAIASISGKPVLTRNIKAVHQLQHAAPDLACSYGIAGAHTSGDRNRTTFPLVFVPDTSGLLVGNVLAKANRGTP